MFHGTSAKALDAIIAEGFKIGGISGPEGVPMVSCGAVFGHGVYLSENPDYAQGYIRDAVNHLRDDGVLRLLFAKCIPSSDSVRVPASGATYFHHELQVYNCYCCTVVILSTVLNIARISLHMHVGIISYRHKWYTHPI